MRLYDPESPFVLVVPTEIECKARKTEYVGVLGTVMNNVKTGKKDYTTTVISQ
jgi:hypothetical protein